MIEITVKFQYDPDLSSYPDATTQLEAAKQDITNLDDGMFSLDEFVDGKEFTITATDLSEVEKYKAKLKDAESIVRGLGSLIDGIIALDVDPGFKAQRFRDMAKDLQEFKIDE